MPTLSQEAQTPWKGGGRVPRVGCSSASCLPVLWPPSRQAALSTRRKVARLARPVCLSSNRTQEEAQGWLTPSCWPGGRHLRRREACLLPVPRRYRSRARAGSPLPPCSELTLPLPQQERGVGGFNTHPTPAHLRWARKTIPPRGGGAGLWWVCFLWAPAGPLSHPEGAIQAPSVTPLCLSEEQRDLLSLKLLPLSAGGC